MALALSYSGCLRGANRSPCPKCNESRIWAFERRNTKVWDRLGKNLEHFRSDDVRPGGITVTGGEPFDQDPQEIIQDIRELQTIIGPLPVLVYSGYERENFLPGGHLFGHPLLAEADYVKTGRYDKNVPPVTGSLLSSGNQRFFSVLEGRLAHELNEFLLANEEETDLCEVNLR
jgi:hypothetical protein